MSEKEKKDTENSTEKSKDKNKKDKKEVKDKGDEEETDQDEQEKDDEEEDLEDEVFEDLAKFKEEILKGDPNKQERMLRAFLVSSYAEDLAKEAEGGSEEIKKHSTFLNVFAMVGIKPVKDLAKSALEGGIMGGAALIALKKLAPNAAGKLAEYKQKLGGNLSSLKGQAKTLGLDLEPVVQPSTDGKKPDEKAPDAKSTAGDAEKKPETSSKLPEKLPEAFSAPFLDDAGNPIKHNVTSGFGDRKLNGHHHHHNGCDLVPVGVDQKKAKIYAVTAGTISSIKHVGKGDGGYGNTIAVKVGIGAEEHEIRYAHFKSLNPDLKVGQTINAKAFLGVMGTTGNSTGEHLHLEVQNTATKQRVDPKSRLEKTPA